VYLHIGQETVVKYKDIIAIFNFENTSVSKITQEFLVQSSHQNQVVYSNDELPKSFIVAQHKKKKTVYISSLSTATLVKRGNTGGIEG